MSSLLVCVALFAPTLTFACGGSQPEGKTAAQVERVEGVDSTIERFKEKDPTIGAFFSKSRAYVVLPTIGEGAFILGGGHGTGEAFEGGTYIGKVTLSELTIGAQVGGQSYSQVVFFETPEAVRRLKENTFKFDAEVSAIAADKGVAQNAKFQDGVATFIIPKKGLMAAAAVGGQKLDFTAAK